MILSALDIEVWYPLCIVELEWLKAGISTKITLRPEGLQGLVHLMHYLEKRPSLTPVALDLQNDYISFGYYRDINFHQSHLQGSSHRTRCGVVDGP